MTVKRFAFFFASVVATLLLFATPSYAAIAVDNADTGTSASGVNSLTYTHVVTSESEGIIVVHTTAANGDTFRDVSSVSCNGVLGTFIGGQTGDGSSSNLRKEMWTCTGYAAGNVSIHVVWDADTNASRFRRVNAVSYTGVDPTTPIANFLGAQGTTTDARVAVGATSGALTVYSAAMVTGTWSSAYDGSTNRYHGSTTNCYGDKASATGTYVGETFTTNPKHTVAIRAELNPSGTIPTPTPTPTITPTPTLTPVPTNTPAPSLAFDAVASGFNSGGTNCNSPGATATLTVVTASNTVIIIALGDNAGTNQAHPTTVTVDGSAATYIGSRDQSTTASVDLYYYKIGTTGSKAVHAVWPSSPSACSIVAASYVGVDQTTVVQNFHSNVGNSLTASTTNGTTSGDWTVAFAKANAGYTAWSSTYDSMVDRAHSTSWQIGDKVSGSGNVGGVWTGSNQNWAIGAVELIPGAAPTPTPTPTPTPPVAFHRVLRID